jgi:PAS domain S-box-containing protein
MIFRIFRGLRNLSVRSWLGHLLAPDLMIAAIVLAMLLASVYGAYRIVAAQFETSAIKAATEIAEGDVRLLVEYWANIENRVSRLHATARTVTLAQRKGDAAEMDQALAQAKLAIAVSIPGIIQVGATDERGIVAWSSVNPPSAHPDLSEREHIRAILHEGRESFIGQPVVGVISGQRTLQFAAAQRSDDGVLTGVSVVSFDYKRAEELAREIVRHPHDVVTLIRDDRVVLARSDGQGIGAAVMPARIVTSRHGGWAVMVARRPSQIDGIQRIFVREHVPDSDLSVTVGLDEAAVLDEALAFEAQYRIGVYLFCFVLTLLVAAAVVARRQAHRIRAHRLRTVSETARNSLLHEIADQSQDLVAVLDEDLRYAFVNDASRELIGEAPAKIIGRELGCFLQPEAGKTFRARIGSISAAGRRSHRVTIPVHLQKSGLRWMEVEMSRIEFPTSPGMTRNGWFLSARDVTARKVAEQELLRANENLSAVAQNGPGVLYRVEALENGAGRLAFITGGKPEFLGHKVEAWVTKGFAKSLVHPADAERFRQLNLDRICNGGKTTEFRMRHADGHYAWIRDTAGVARQEDGTYSITGYAMDVSAEKEQAATLEHAQRLLSLGDLASGVGHELGQPLAAISLAAGSGMMALERGASGIKLAQEKLDHIARMTDRAGAIIENMRLLGRQEAQATAWTQLSDCVAQALGMVQERLDREQVAVSMDVPRALPAVLLAPLLFQQVLINLIANACDAYLHADTPATGAKTIKIEARAGEDQVTLRITDRAGGIPPDIIGRIFEPFFTTKGPNRGTGLGLSVCYGTVRQAGGLLSVYNECGGAAFEITLPLLRQADCGPAPKPTRTLAKTHP